jgi:anti-repressor protein
MDANNNPRFCGKDAAQALGYKDTVNALKQHCRGVAEYHPITDSLGRTQQAVFINEGDLYRLIASSKLPAAQEFESWVFDEVIPQIRQTGGYIPQGETPEETMARAVLIAQKTIQMQKQQLAEQQPKVLFADAVAASHTNILVGDLAKILHSNGIDIGGTRLFQWLRDNGYLMKSGMAKNMPTQKSMELGLFKVKETTVVHADGHTSINKTPKVTGKGQAYFVSKFLGRKDLVLA